MEQQNAVNNEQAAEGSDKADEKFKQWCAVVEMSAQLLGAKAIPMLAKQGRESFGLSVLWQREPASIELLSGGNKYASFEGELATEFMDVVDQVQNSLRSKGLNLARDDIAIATLIRQVACEALGIAL